MKIPREKSSEKRRDNQPVTARDRLLAITEVLNARDGKTLKGSYDVLLQIGKLRLRGKMICQRLYSQLETELGLEPRTHGSPLFTACHE